jgi:hypothetical protein
MTAPRPPFRSLVAPLAFALVLGACADPIPEPPPGMDVPGPATLVRIDDEPAGLHCASGGVAVHTGVDDDRDGALDDAEIDATDYVCDAEVWQGDFGPDQWTDPAKVAVLHRVRAVTGNLSLLDAADLPRLEVVGGQLGLGKAPAALPSLWLIGGDLVLAGATAEVRLPALTTIGGRLYQWAGSTVGTLALPALTRVNGDIELHGGLTRADLSQLTSLGGSLTIWCPGLAELALDQLRSIDGDVTLERVHALTRLELPALERIDGGISIAAWEGEVGVEVLAAPRLGQVGSIFIANAPALTAIDLSSLTAPDAVGGDVTLVNLPALRDLALPLSYVGNHFQQPANVTIEATGLEALDLPLIRVNGELRLASNPALRAARFASLTRARVLDVTGNPGLELLSAPGVDGLTSLWLAADPALVRIELGGVTALSALTVRTIGVVDLAGLPSLHLAIDVDLESNPNLTSLAGTSLAAASRVTIAGNPALRSLAGLEGITELGDLDLNENAVLDNLDGLAALQAIHGDLAVRNHAQLRRLGLTALGAVSGDVLFDNNPAALQPEIDALLARLGRTVTARRGGPWPASPADRR